MKIPYHYFILALIVGISLGFAISALKPHLTNLEDYRIINESCYNDPEISFGGVCEKEIYCGESWIYSKDSECSEDGK